MPAIETELDGQGRRIGVVVSRFNHLLTHRLLEACCQRLEGAGCAEPDVVWVPGAFEIPLAAERLVATGRYDAIVALGVVVRGATPHFDNVCRAVTDGLRALNLAGGVPVAFGVLTTDTVEQALERAATGDEPGANKGAEAAEVALEMAGLLPAIAARS